MTEELVAGAAPEVAESEVTPEATPQPEGEVSQETPAQPTPEDATAQKWQADLNKLKSASQRQLYEEQQRFAAREEWYRQQMAEMERQMYERTVQGMSPEERQAYNNQLQQQQLERQRQAEIEQLRQQVGQLSQERAIQERQEGAVQLFSWLTGLPAEKLNEHADDPQRLLGFVRDYVVETSKKASKQPPTPPKVTTQRAGGSGGILSRWADMTPQQRNEVIERAASGGLPASEL